MARQTLKNRIDKLINDLGSSLKPGPVDVRNRLVLFGGLAEALENGQAVAEAKAEIAALEKQIADVQAMHKTQSEEVQAMHKTQLEKLQAESADLEAMLEKANTEINRLLQEQDNRAKKNQEMPLNQFRILKALPFQDRGGLSVYDIGLIIRSAIPADEIGFHLAELKKSGHAEIGGCNAFDAQVWKRSAEGNTYVLEKRWSEAAQDRDKNRSEIEEEILLLTPLFGMDTIPLKAWSVGFYLDIGEEMARVHLERLRNDGLVTADVIPDEAEVTWHRTPAAAEYLARRGLLQKQYEEREKRRKERDSTRDP